MVYDVHYELKHFGEIAKFGDFAKLYEIFDIEILHKKVFTQWRIEFISSLSSTVCVNTFYVGIAANYDNHVSYPWYDKSYENYDMNKK